MSISRPSSTRESSIVERPTLTYASNSIVSEYKASEDPIPEDMVTDDRNEVDVLRFMHVGSKLLKLCNRRNLSHWRAFRLSPTNDSITWYSAKKDQKATTIKISRIKEVISCSSEFTQRFARSLPREYADYNFTNQEFTIAYEAVEGRATTAYLHLIACDVRVACLWTLGLRKLMQCIQDGIDLSTLHSMTIPVLAVEHQVTLSMLDVTNKSATADDLEKFTTTLERVNGRFNEIVESLPRRYLDQYHGEVDVRTRSRGIVALLHRTRDELNGIQEFLREGDVDREMLKVKHFALCRIEVDVGALSLRAARIRKSEQESGSA